VEISRAFVIEVMAGRQGSGVLACCEPGLGYGAFREAVGRAGAAHSGWYPSRVHAIRINLFPFTGDGKGEDDVMQL